MHTPPHVGSRCTRAQRKLKQDPSPPAVPAGILVVLWRLYSALHNAPNEAPVGASPTHGSDGGPKGGNAVH